MKILLLEDDLMLSELIKEHLSEKGYEVIHFLNGEEAFEYLYEKRVDLILLDIKVPGISGFELLKKLRENKDTTPAIMITSANSSKDVKEGFELGCDDYIKKPFEFEELDARVEHILKLFNINNGLIDFKILKFDHKRHLLIFEDKEISLTPKASEILHYLYKNRGKIVTKEELIQNIWNYDGTPSEATIRSYIKMLRKYIPFIKTYRGTGYELEPL
ncbi:response regulator transcription factor [Nitrosophilus labii]|uniref:response regulator transcription factor n=1 Tax=Nitrosophilus labii TaxID=2706014 RepID=UPI001656E070|nr:response regulator transcription factor [Nitrosophilus labii]